MDAISAEGFTDIDIGKFAADLRVVLTAVWPRPAALPDGLLVILSPCVKSTLTSLPFHLTEKIPKRFHHLIASRKISDE